jgi:hypothetical protein
MEKGGLKRGTAGHRHAWHSVGQKDRHTFFFRHELVMNRHDPEARTHILNFPPFSSDSDPFPCDYPNRKIHPSAGALCRHPAPQIRRQRPQIRLSSLRFTPSLGVFPLDRAVAG